MAQRQRKTHWIFHRNAIKTVCGKQAQHPRRWTHTCPSCVDCKQCLKFTKKLPGYLIRNGTSIHDVMAVGAMLAYLARTQAGLRSAAPKVARRIAFAAQSAELPLEYVNEDAILAVYRTRTPGEWLAGAARGPWDDSPWFAVAMFAEKILLKYSMEYVGNPATLANRELSEWW